MITSKSLDTNTVVSAALSYTLPIIAFTILTALGALIRIPLPMTPVPMTLQTFFVVLGGLMLGANRGAISQALYIAWGASGLPLFAGGAAGLAILTGPTGGYLLGFVFAAYISGWLGKNLRSTVSIFLVALLSSVVILLCGWLGLMAFVGHDPVRALKLGVLPFIVDDIIKTLAVTGVFYTYIKRIHRTK